MSKLVLSKLALFVLHDGICGSFNNKATINASTLDEDSFNMLYKNDCWAAIPDPLWTTNVPYERKINMLSSTDNNVMICLFDFERSSIESRFPFFFTHTVTAMSVVENWWFWFTRVDPWPHQPHPGWPLTSPPHDLWGDPLSTLHFWFTE